MKNLEKLRVFRLSAKKASFAKLWIMASFLSVMSSFFHLIFLIAFFVRKHIYNYCISAFFWGTQVLTSCIFCETVSLWWSHSRIVIIIPIPQEYTWSEQNG